MLNQEIIDYVKNQTQLGSSKEVITMTLLNSGWQQEDIDSAFRSLSNPVEVNTIQSPASQNSDMDREFASKGKFGRSMILFKTCLKVLMMDKEIALFPILSSIASIFVVALFAFPLYKLDVLKNDTANSSPFTYVLVFSFYLVSYFVIVFFNTGLVTCAQIRLSGGNPTFKDGIDNAMKHVGKIFIWALVSATVGMILRMIAERSKLLGRLVAYFVGMAWTLVTYFIVPILIFENMDVIESIKESGALFKKTWGENVIGNISMGLVFFLLSLLGFVPIVLAIMSESLMFLIISFGLLLVYFLVLGIISASLKGIFDVALYNYAKTGQVSAYFGEGMMKSAFVAKK